MTSYFAQVRRTPKPGRFASVLQGQIEALNSSNQTGAVAFTISGNTKQVVLTNFMYNSIQDVENHNDGVFGNPDRLAAFDSRGSECEETRFLLSRIVECPIQSGKSGQDEEIKFGRRNVITAKTGELASLVEVLMEFREAFETSTPGISVPVGGDTHAVRTLTTVSSLEQLEAWQEELTSSRMLPFRERINNLIVEQSVELNRIVHRNRP